MPDGERGSGLGIGISLGRNPGYKENGQSLPGKREYQRFEDKMGNKENVLVKEN